MKKITLLFLCMIFLFACNQTQVDIAKAEQEIMQADKDMNTLAGEGGFFQALFQYCDTDVVLLSEGEFPVIGKQAFSEFAKTKKVFTNLSWEPVKAEVAQSGELGYTWGKWKFVKPDSTYYGKYFTVWKKQADGSWKFVLDGGNSTPAPLP